ATAGRFTIATRTFVWSEPRLLAKASPGLANLPGATDSVTVSVAVNAGLPDIDETTSTYGHRNWMEDHWAVRAEISATSQMCCTREATDPANVSGSPIRLGGGTVVTALAGSVVCCAGIASVAERSTAAEMALRMAGASG